MYIRHSKSLKNYLQSISKYSAFYECENISLNKVYIKKGLRRVGEFFISRDYKIKSLYQKDKITKLKLLNNILYNPI